MAIFHSAKRRCEKMVEPTAVGWIDRWLWKDFHPKRVYKLRRDFHIVECANQNWPVLFVVAVQEYHVFEASPETIKNLIALTKMAADGERCFETGHALQRLAHPERSNDFRPGDGLRFWWENGSWNFEKMHQGMVNARLSDADCSTICSILIKITLLD